MKNEMDEVKFENDLKASRPETPYGFDTRVDAKVDSLVREGRKHGIRLPSRRAVFALVLVAVLGLSGVIAGIAGSGNVPASSEISTRVEHSATITEDTWYPDNTAGLAGLPLRDLYPSLTDKWYNVVPVDLTKHGRQTYSLVASNIYYIGEVYVDVSADTVTVSYATYKGNLKKGDECVQWFLDPADITSAFLNDPHGDYAFGQKVSIRDDLNGADVALLFVCNKVTYRIPYDDEGHALVRYWPNKDDWKEYREGLNTLMDQLSEQVIRMREEKEAAERAAAEAAAAEEAAKAAAEEAAADAADSSATEAPAANR